MSGLTRNFLGIGWKFPLQVTPAGRIAQARYEQRIEESIFLILSTVAGRAADAAGLRLRHPRPRVRGQHAPPPSPSSRGPCAPALTAYEPRIDVLDVAAGAPPEQENLLLIRISYRIRANNAIGNLVYPFYIREAV